MTMRPDARTVALVVGLAAMLVAPARAQGEPTAPEPDAPSGWTTSRSLLQHFGMEAARPILHDGASSRTEALRGIDRAMSLGSPEGTLLVLQLLQDRQGTARADAQVLLNATRALAPFARQKPVARALAEAVLNASGGRAPARAPADAEAAPPARDPFRRARFELARETAALALAEAGGDEATALLSSAARRSGPGQAAALRALGRRPPAAPPGASTDGAEQATVAAMFGDLRPTTRLHEALEAGDSLDTRGRIAAIDGAAGLGDGHAAALAGRAADDGDPALRETATAAEVELGAPAAPGVVRLIEDERTAARGVELARRVPGGAVTRALAASAKAGADRETRRGAVAALGERADTEALEALGALRHEPVLARDAEDAIARSPAPGAWGVVADTLRDAASRRAGARMAVVRARGMGPAPDPVLRLLRSLASASADDDRAVGMAALVLIGAEGPARGLEDASPVVRRAVAMACEPTDANHARALAARLAREHDAIVRRLLARRLAVPDSGRDTTGALSDAVRAGDVDAPLSAFALTAREGADRGAAAVLLGSEDPLVRAHAARGLGLQAELWAVGLLARAYETEVDAGARHALVSALALHTEADTLAIRSATLALAAQLDPEPSVRDAAARARSGLARVVAPTSRDTLLLRATTAGGAPPHAPLEGLVVRPDGLAVPVVFDPDGYALIPSPRGPARLVLAPRLPSYEPAAHGD
jgi:hypothetical protein